MGSWRLTEKETDPVELPEGVEDKVSSWVISIMTLQGVAAVAAVATGQLVAVHELGTIEDVADMARKGKLVVGVIVPSCLPRTNDFAPGAVGCNLGPASGLVDAGIVDPIAGALDRLPVGGILTDS